MLIRKGHSSVDGGCSFCTTRITTRAWLEESVWVLERDDKRGVQARICYSCAAQFVHVAQDIVATFIDYTPVLRGIRELLDKAGIK